MTQPTYAKALWRSALVLMIFAAAAFAYLTDTNVYFPPNYNTFQPPAVGGSYVDPVFGTTIKRISDALHTPDIDAGGYLPWISTEYSTMSPFNLDKSFIILDHFSYFGLYDGSGKYLRDLPIEVNTSSEPRWSRSDPNVVYYIHGNQLKKCDVSTNSLTVAHTFS